MRPDIVQLATSLKGTWSLPSPENTNVIKLSKGQASRRKSLEKINFFKSVTKPLNFPKGRIV